MGSWLNEINIVVYVLVCLFAISSWISLNGMWVQLPLLVKSLPEAWDLPAYMTIIIQLANIGPIAYTILNKIYPHVINEPPVVVVIILVGAISCLLLAFFWQVTSYVGDVLHSTVFLGLALVLALVDCTSSVVYLPYMAAFKPQYMTALYFGESLSGLLPGVIGLIQGAGGNPVCVNISEIVPPGNMSIIKVKPIYSSPLFSVQVFFFVLFGVMIISGVAFSLLHYLPVCKNERTAGINVQRSLLKKDMREKNNFSHYGSIESELDSHSTLLDASYKSQPQTETSVFSDRLTVSLFFFIVWLNCITNGLMPSLQTYSVLPYGNNAYSMVVILSIIVSPLVSLVALFVRLRSRFSVTVLMISGTVFTSYNLYLAVHSPFPPLLGQTGGEFLAVNKVNFLIFKINNMHTL